MSNNLLTGLLKRYSLFMTALSLSVFLSLPSAGESSDRISIVEEVDEIQLWNDTMLQYDDEEYAEAIEGFEYFANQGDADAQYFLGMIYLDQEDDSINSAKYLRMSSEQGHTISQFVLGYMYHEGMGVPQNYNEAIKLYSSSGISHANYNLGAIYSRGEGVERDNKTAEEYFLSASDEGHGDASFNLGVLYYGEDFSEAERFFRIAAEQGNSTSKLVLGSMYFLGHGVEQNREEARKWFIEYTPKSVLCNCYQKENPLCEKPRFEFMLSLYKCPDEINQADAKEYLERRTIGLQGKEGLWAIDFEEINNYRVSPKLCTPDGYFFLGMIAYHRDADYVLAHKWWSLASVFEDSSISRKAKGYTDYVTQRLTQEELSQAQDLAMEEYERCL